MLKVIIFGNQQICVDCISVLNKNANIEVSCVVGSELERDIKFGYGSVRDFCRSKKIKFYNPEILDQNFLNEIKKYNADLCFSVYFRKILNQNYIDYPKMGFINMHPSLLPSYRGPAPTMWALIKGERMTGMTMHYIDVGIDTGDIIAQKKINIPRGITGFELNTLVMNKGVELFKEQLPKIINKKNKRIKQNHKIATYFGSFVPSVAQIQWFDNKDTIQNRVNALTRPYNGAVASLKGEKVIFWKIKILQSILKGSGGPGKIIAKSEDGSFIVRTVDGFIKVIDYEIFSTNKNIKSQFIRVGDRFEV